MATEVWRSPGKVSGGDRVHVEAAAIAQVSGLEAGPPGSGGVSRSVSVPELPSSSVRSAASDSRNSVPHRTGSEIEVSAGGF